MLKLDSTTLQKSLEQLDNATRDHAEWQENLLRSIVCGLPPGSGDLADDAYLHCQFGRWYYESAPADLWGQPALAAIGPEHPSDEGRPRGVGVE